MTKEELRDIYFGFYDQLNEPERSEAKENYNYNFGEDREPESVRDSVALGFSLTTTRQGFSYWNSIDDLLIDEKYPLNQKIINQSNIMTREKQEAHFEAFVQKQREVLLRKGNDYSHEDRLSNFKLAGSICGLTPEQNCLSLIATKVARLGVLLGGKTPNNESIQDSVLDLANYSVLLDMIISEKQNDGLDSIIKKDYNGVRLV